MRTLMLAILAACLCLSAVAAPAGRDMAKEEAIWKQLEAAAPAALPTFKDATTALDADDFARAAALYGDVLKAAPRFAPAMRRQATALLRTGRADEATTLASAAVAIERSPANLSVLAQCLMETGTQADARQAIALLQEADRTDDRANEGETYALMGLAALTAREEQQFHEAVDVLRQRHQDMGITHYLLGIEALMQDRPLKADKEFEKARRLGVPAEMMADFYKGELWWPMMLAHAFNVVLWLVIAVGGGWAVGLVLLFVIGKAMSGAMLRAIESADPNAPLSPGEASLRKWYRVVIGVAGVYYYISLPVIAGLVIGGTGMLLYGIFMFGHIPVKLVIILIVVALATLIALLKSLFLRFSDEDPGRPVREAEAPGLLALTREVAAAVGTRPIDEVRITPGTDCAVYENGSYRERVKDRARRILILGAGVLDGFSVNAFRAVLAHEYGHFQHRDTAGGDLALRVNANMMKFAEGLYASGAAVVWNLGFQFLRLYHFLFRRISHGSTRLQEVLADRLAARTYGPKAFEDGLTHVIRRSVAFDNIASTEIQAAMEGARALQNLYAITEHDAETVAKEIDEGMARATSEDDTHPAPRDRFRLIASVIAAESPDDPRMVWDLFADREAVTAEMSAEVSRRLQEAMAAAPAEV